MLVGTGCLSCLVEQADRVLREAGISREKRIEILKEVLEFLEDNFRWDSVPAVVGTYMHRMLKERIGVRDVYSDKKDASNKTAMKLLPKARELISKSPDPLRESFRMAIAGNIIDFGIYEADIDKLELDHVLEDNLVIDEFPRVKEFLSTPKKILYLCDNAGEVAFDTLAIKELKRQGHEVTAVIKSGPIINDATLEDAIEVGLDSICTVIEVGSDSIGTIFDETSEEFNETLESSDVIISKGQGNYETLSDFQNKAIIFLFKAKCVTVASHLGLPEKSSIIIFKENKTE